MIGLKLIPDKRRLKKDHTYPLIFRINFKGETRDISTGYSTKTKDWSKKKYLFLIKVSDGGNQAVANFLVTHELTEKLEKGYSFEYKIEQNENYNEK